MNGRTFKRCPCGTVKDARGRTVACPKRHGTWSFMHEVPAGRDQKRRQVKRGGFASQRAAVAAMQESLDSLRRGPVLEQPQQTVGDYLDEWLDGKAGLRPTTLSGYRTTVEIYLKPGLGHLRLRDLREADIEDLYVAIGLLGRPDLPTTPLIRRLLDVRDGRAVRPLSPTSVRRVHACLTSALTSAVKRRRLGYNPARHVELAPARRPRAVVWTADRVEHWRRTGERPAVAVWTAEQAGSFLDSISDHELYPLLHLVAFRGLRRGEAVGLRWVDVDLAAREARITQQIVQLGWRTTHAGDPKTASGARTITLDAATSKVLRAHRQDQEALRASLGPTWVDHGLVFPAADGGPRDPATVSNDFQRLVRAADLPPIRLHDLRHTAASLALQAGVPLKVVSEQLGHSSLAITADTYTSVLPAVAQAAAEAVAGLVPRRATGAAVPSQEATEAGPTDVRDGRPADM